MLVSDGPLATVAIPRVTIVTLSVVFISVAVIVSYHGPEHCDEQYMIGLLM